MDEIEVRDRIAGEIVELIRSQDGEANIVSNDEGIFIIGATIEDVPLSITVNVTP